MIYLKAINKVINKTGKKIYNLSLEELKDHAVVNKINPEILLNCWSNIVLNPKNFN